jgi:hypothetical protein
MVGNLLVLEKNKKNTYWVALKGLVSVFVLVNYYIKSSYIFLDRPFGLVIVGFEC